MYNQLEEEIKILGIKLNNFISSIKNPDYLKTKTHSHQPPQNYNQP